MSTIKVNSIESTSTADGGISIDTSGHVTVDGVAMPSAGPLSSRNFVINGAMQLAQRSTQETGVTSGDYLTVDRFSISLSSLGTWTLDQSTDAPDGFSNSFKATCTTADASPAASDYAYFRHRIEAQNLQGLGFGSSAAQSTTISFYVKSNKTGNASFNVLQPDSSFRMVGFQYSISTADTWERKTITIPGDASGTINNDNGNGLQLEWWFNSGSDWTGGSHQATWTANVSANRNASNLGVGGATSDYFAITGVQLEVGSVATPFEHRSYGDELRRCQRYYFRDTHTVTSGPEHFFFTGYMLSVTQFEGVYDFPVEMRSAPSLGRSALSTFHLRNGGVAPTSINGWAPTTRSMSIYTGSSSVGSQWQGSALRGASGSGTTTYLEFIAEL